MRYSYHVSSTKVNVRMQGLRSQKKHSLHGVNEHFFDERNAAGEHYDPDTNYTSSFMI